MIINTTASPATNSIITAAAMTGFTAVISNSEGNIYKAPQVPDIMTVHIKILSFEKGMQLLTTDAIVNNIKSKYITV